MRAASVTKETKRAMYEESTEVSLLDRELSNFEESRAVVDLYRQRLESDGMLSRVIQWSQHVLIVERLNDEYVYDGLSAIRPADVTRIRAYDRELLAAPRLISNERPAPLDEVALLELSAATTKLFQRYSAVAVYTERLEPQAVFVGEPVDLDDDFLVLRAWGTARNADSYRVILRLSDVTRVDADTAYIRTLRQLRHGLE
jgi:hypothetical protein